MYTHLNEQLLLEMAEIGRIDGYKILVYGSEGPIPHFHVENKEKEVFCCVKILEPAYFEHSKYNSVLPKSIVKKLAYFLNSSHKLFGKYGMSNWEVICVYWNDNNPDYQIKEKIENLKIPDYFTL